ncbi:hypothetical protein [Saccharicrinis fermentans]|uniref:Uncharacterized protein n=1 Tax=Saccharicrinis fermentans DSM 9555 = JCM 21142 TaxID=869213 RepID=W7Y2X7_9BACT|nr:hypothetical protein JCM21142_93900 [Saccharicrinis fermentans DSM 9555 = JCM 21142]
MFKGENILEFADTFNDDKACLTYLSDLSGLMALYLPNVVTTNLLLGKRTLLEIAIGARVNAFKLLKFSTKSHRPITPSFSYF